MIQFHLQIILSSRVNIEKAKGYEFLIPWLGTGLLISGGKFLIKLICKHLYWLFVFPNWCWLYRDKLYGQNCPVGSKWHQRRKLLTPTFHFSILESFLPSINENSRTFVEKLKKLETKEEEWNIFPFINKFTLDVICGNYTAL